MVAEEQRQQPPPPRPARFPDIPHPPSSPEYKREYRRRVKREQRAEIKSRNEPATRGTTVEATTVEAFTPDPPPAPSKREERRTPARDQARDLVANIAGAHATVVMLTGVEEFALTPDEEAQLTADWERVFARHPLPESVANKLVFGPAIKTTAHIEYRKAKVFMAAQAEKPRRPMPSFKRPGRPGGPPPAARPAPPAQNGQGGGRLVPDRDPVTGLTIYREEA